MSTMRGFVGKKTVEFLYDADHIGRKNATTRRSKVLPIRWS
jgi:hypothetical protein